ncbi:PaaI family thioesterase [Verticiella sediminum]|uniref:PaaI family thioesterase n=1 Tax=Verticiella sediminum TaxID=1247510 RepID=A0A556B1A0_9BURK|nr:PaaI family thioesterase [Verticiella sediminum]TSH98971.1 PaaI family thioesterase [Verticiella sediminum]
MTPFTLDTAAHVLADTMPGCVRGLNLTVEKLEDGHATLRMPYSDMACREGGIFSGQALAALADTSMCFAVWMDGRGRRPVATVDLHVTYLRGAGGEDLLARAQLIRSGKTLAFARVDIVLAGSGKEVASAVATFGLPA